MAAGTVANLSHPITNYDMLMCKLRERGDYAGANKTYRLSFSEVKTINGTCYNLDSQNRGYFIIHGLSSTGGSNECARAYTVSADKTKLTFSPNGILTVPGSSTISNSYAGIPLEIYGIKFPETIFTGF